VNFGRSGLELFVDRQPSRGGVVGLIGSNCAVPVVCGTETTTLGLTGSENPWVIGASTEESSEGSTDALVLPFRSGQVDAFFIRTATRAFDLGG
jgi:hypothetical protein